MFWLFTNKKRVEDVREETKKGFESVKNDILSVSEWIKHLDIEKNIQKTDINNLRADLKSIKEDILEIKNKVHMMDILGSNTHFKQTTKTNNQLFNKETSDYSNQTRQQTGVQTPNLSTFSITERAIIGVLLNSDLKLSYEDLATLLGKEKSTIRGQLNTIKSKSNGLINESIETNGKKRVYISKEIKEKLMKKAKIKVNSSKNQKNEGSFE
ncbi:MAG: hypothetical protein PF542_05785 [Nanoarchaeota archaeon]|jgi:hypothetical protein|nr:hypothetical protein [Nanoarchaeota archaeon]